MSRPDPSDLQGRGHRRIGPSSQLDLARAISQAVQKGAHVINISGGEFSPSGTAHPILANAVRDCASLGVLIVAAAGNDGVRCSHIPGALPSALAVGAMDSTGAPLRFSNWGTRYLAQGILAPGENIEGARSGGGTALNSGTSYATPVVSGVAALLLSLQLKLGRKPDPSAVRASILESAIGCDVQPAPDCRRVLAGRLNVKGAMTRKGDAMPWRTWTEPMTLKKKAFPAVYRPRGRMATRRDVAAARSKPRR